jgi:membrane protease YdiL (CAAX protease family)
MSRVSLNPVTQVPADRPIGLAAVWVFCLVTVALTVATLFLLPGYAGPALVVFIPTITAVTLITLTAGKSQVRPRLFSVGAWHLSLKWLLISLGVALALRLGVSVLGLLFVPGYPWQPGPFSPLLLMAFLFAAAEEIGWRGFALPALLAHGYRPLTTILLLGVPWALLHLPLVLPGMLSAGTPMLAQFLIMMAMSVLVTWAYLAGGNSLSPAVLLHGGQNIFVILNNGLNPVASGWLMAAVYGAAALLVILLTRGRLGLALNAVK